MFDFPRIWLIGGTRESVRLAEAMVRMHVRCTVSVTTESARSLYGKIPQLRVWVGLLDEETLEQFLPAENIAAIVDASHPYAVAISELAISTARSQTIPYLRYERPEISPQNTEYTLRLPNFDTLLSGNYLTGQRVLLTVGYRPLAAFKPWQMRSTLFARILPSPTALEAALKAGFTNDRLIALRPPISVDLERSLWRQWQISMVVTKASGSAGGEDAKQAVAAELGTKLVIIDRPKLDYPRQTSEIDEVVAFCRQIEGAIEK